MFEGTLVRTRTKQPSAYRSLLPSYEQKKCPWVNKFFYNFPFGMQNGTTPFSNPNVQANLDKIRKRELYLEIAPKRGCTDVNTVDSFIVFGWAETYNILRVYGGRAGMLFAY